MKKKNLIIAAGVGLLVVLGASTLLGLTKRPPQESRDVNSITEVLSEPRPVVVEEVSLNPSVKDRRFPGIVTAVEQTQLSFRIHGPLVALTVKPGDIVKKGQLLMQVDPRDFQDRIAVLEAQLAVISAKYKKAAADFERAKTLFTQTVIPQADYDADQSDYDASAAAVKDCQARLQIAKHELEDTALLAPYDGIITKKYVENHEMINVGQVVLGMQDISRLKIEVEVPENEITRHTLQHSESARIEFPSAEGRHYPATLLEWNTAADPVTRTYTVVFVMKAPDDVSILPGMTAQAQWVANPSCAQVLTLPARSVMADTQGRSFVWVFDPQSCRAQQRFVETGELVNSNRIQIRQGLEPGERIVGQGADFITATMTLRPVHSEAVALSCQSERSR